MKSPEILKQYAGFNKIINGNFDYWQRGASFTLDGYTSDRWMRGISGVGAFTFSQSLDVPNIKSKYSARLEMTTANTSPTASDLHHFQQRVEGFILRDLIGKYVTYSFYVKSNIVGKYYVSLSMVDKTTTGMNSYIASYEINSVDTWEKKSVNLYLDPSFDWETESSTATYLSFTLMSGSNYQGVEGQNTGNIFSANDQVNFDDTIGNYIQFSQVMLHEGKEALEDYVYAGGDIFNELRLCQRYYETGRFVYYNRNTSASRDFMVSFNVIKRAVPQIIRTSNAYTSNEEGTLISYESFDRFAFYNANKLAVGGVWKADAEL